MRRRWNIGRKVACSLAAYARTIWRAGKSTAPSSRITATYWLVRQQTTALRASRCTFAFATAATREPCAAGKITRRCRHLHVAALSVRLLATIFDYGFSAHAAQQHRLVWDNGGTYNAAVAYKRDKGESSAGAGRASARGGAALP